MQALLDSLPVVIERMRANVSDGLGAGSISGASDDDLLEVLTLAAEVGRLAEALVIECVGEVGRRSETPERDQRLTIQRGCHDVSELVQRVTRVAPSSAARLQRAARAIRVERSLLGDALPPLLPAMRGALIDGEVGLDGLLAVAGPLVGMGDRVGLDELLAAEGVLAATARGEGPDAAPPACADLLRVHAQAWAAVLDQDGAEPREERAMRLRGVTLGAARDGVIPIRGQLLPEVAAQLLPEVAAQLQRVFDAVCSPRSAADGSVVFRPSAELAPVDLPDDPRRWQQKQRDAFGTALFAAASSGLLPTIGGAAPTVVVSVRAEDLVSQTGWAHIDRCDEPVSGAAARHAGCAGVIQRVLLGGNGRILRLGTEERVFNRHQRRAIALRDGGCVIPGCDVPAGWCEIHHVTEHANDGPTHTDNGVLLCWFHRRFLEASGWLIRMNLGVPQVRAPLWLESSGRWRTVTKSRTRMLDAVKLRT